MAKVSVQIEGMDQVRDALRRMPDQTRVIMADVVAKTAFSARQRTVAGAPVNTGLLRGSITSRSRGLSGRVDITGDAYYWRFLEFGTRYAAARPFVRPAAEAESVAFEQRVRQAATRLERDFASSRLV